MNILRPILILTLSLASISLAQAHAFLDHADPKVGATVANSPTVVKIWFTMQIGSSGSTMEIFDAGGKEVDQHDAKVDAKDTTLMSVSLPKLAAGTYKVAWTAVCSCCNHTTHGSFTFTVGGP